MFERLLCTRCCAKYKDTTGRRSTPSAHVDIDAEQISMSAKRSCQPNKIPAMMSAVQERHPSARGCGLVVHVREALGGGDVGSVMRKTGRLDRRPVQRECRGHGGGHPELLS